MNMATKAVSPDKINAADYPDLQDHISALEEAGLLFRIDRPVNKDTELHPLVRWQFRGGIPRTDESLKGVARTRRRRLHEFECPATTRGSGARLEL